MFGRVIRNQELIVDTDAGPEVAKLKDPQTILQLRYAQQALRNYKPTFRR